MEEGKKKGINLRRLRERLDANPEQGHWKSLDQLDGNSDFQKWVDDEFPHRDSLLEIDRRSLLKFMGASMALAGLTGCRSLTLEKEKVVPFVKKPEEMIAGRPLFFRTAIPRNGHAIGLEVESREGRPIKIEGNPDHPASLGALDSISLASILNLYDPDRSRNVTFHGGIETYEGYVAALQKALGRTGQGFRLVTETVISPTYKRAIDRFLREYPDVVWHQWDPLHRDAVHEGTEMAFGQPLDPVYSLQGANTILSVDADFVVSGMPGSIRYSREMMDGRRHPESGRMNRLYAVQTMPTVNGIVADHMMPMNVGQIRDFLLQLLGVGSPSDFARAVAGDLTNGGVVVAGEHLPADIHALVHQLNAAIGAVGSLVNYITPIEVRPESKVESLRSLHAAISRGEVTGLLVIGANPVYTAPGDLDFGQLLQPFLKSGSSFHMGLYADETAQACAWHAPEAHYLEAWGDTRAYDGTVSILQPLIDPLYAGRTATEVLGLAAREAKLAYDWVRETWRSLDDKAWRRAIHDGLVAESARAPMAGVTAVGGLPRTAEANGFEIHFRPDPTIGDGFYANNGWLQELPKPVTKIVWDNVVHVSPNTAEQMGLSNEDHVTIQVGNRSIVGPIWIVPGHADNAATVHLGYGRTAGGAVTMDSPDKPRGFNAYRVQDSTSPWVAAGSIKKADGTTVIALTQDHNSMEGRDLIRMGSIDQYPGNPNFAPHGPGSEHDGPTFYNLTKEWAEKNPDLPQWGMTIDLNTCIACNACVTACQAENNIPVVGKEQVTRGREMHWIRIDRYYGRRPGHNPLQNPQTMVQPVTCMHCETAPCEPVCPVGATVHSHEGLNQMVYNRCVGTRYCSNNCPYKVRRFNFLNYQHLQPNYKQDKDIPLLRLINNPDVTVRSRGVMEKCTYCVQRINAARIEAKKANRPIRDGEVVTACAQACPTQTIVFGNLNDAEAQATKLRKDPRTYELLAELNTFPRTTYMAKVRNPNPALEQPAAAEGEAH